MRLVIIESPFASNDKTSTRKHIEYARLCVADSLSRGESPIASHLLYTQPGILLDDIPEEREVGISAGLEWQRVAEATVCYMDYGLSRGMARAIESMVRRPGGKVEFRWLYED